MRKLSTVNVGGKVQYRKATSTKLVGEIKAIQGKKWIKVQWSDGVILSEHTNDLELYKKDE